MSLYKKNQRICVIDFFLCLVYLMRSTYMILGAITLVALAISLFYTHNMENIIANRIEFVSSFAMGCMIFIIRTLLHISCNGMMIGIMSIVVGFFLMSFYVVIRMVLFNTIRIVNLMQHSKKPCSKKHMLKKEK